MHEPEFQGAELESRSAMIRSSAHICGSVVSRDYNAVISSQYRSLQEVPKPLAVTSFYQCDDCEQGVPRSCWGRVKQRLSYE